MALLNTGAISLGGNISGLSVNLELLKTANATISIDDSDARALADISTGTIALSDFFGKSYYTFGQEEYTAPGTYTWVCPTGVTSISVLCIGGGGGGSAGTNIIGVGGGGGGGALAYRNAVAVIPNQSYNIVVGSGGTGQITINGTTTQPASAGGQTSAFSCIGGGGQSGGQSSANATISIGLSALGDGGTLGGVYTGGAIGGAGGSIDTSSVGFRAPGGGGAAGYTGIGGAGARGARTAGSPASSAGFSGTAGLGGGAGGVGGSTRSAETGITGAVRIIWPGQLRSFPLTLTDNV